tara:strand:+ start:436 stop:696 length:261 start_codon:yes stop_codon:yes gene_type:complete
MTKTHGFQNDVPKRQEDTYKSVCWHTYPAVDANGKNVGTVRELFPPMMQEGTYGGKMATEIRSLAFDRYNALVREHGAENVQVEML